MGLFEKFKIGLKKTAQQLTSNLEGLFKGTSSFSQEILAEIEDRLIAADVGVGTAQSILLDAQKRLKEAQISDPRAFSKFLREAVYQKLLRANTPFKVPNPVVILLVGVNGAGKTTTAGKLAARFSLEGRKVLLAAADTFRAAAEEQLTEWALRAKVEIIRGAYGAAPSAVVYDALKSGLTHGAECMVVDTAGRLHNRLNLMEELKKIIRVAEKAAPGVAQERWLVLDSNTGQNAIQQTKEFHKEIGVSGIILTKLDGTAKGGIIVALSDQTGLPVRYLGVGEGLDDLVAFDPQLFVEALIPGPVMNA